MVWAPAIGVGGEPLFIPGASGGEPAWAEDPCTCCEEGGGPNKPYANCSLCIDDVIGIRMTVSGFIDGELCTPGAEDAKYTCYHSNANQTYVLTEEDFFGSGPDSKLFFLDISPGCEPDPGLLLGESRFYPDSSDGSCQGIERCVEAIYLYKVEARIRCNGGIMEFLEVVGYTQTCGDPTCPAIGWPGLGGVFASEPFENLCNVGGSAVGTSNVQDRPCDDTIPIPTYDVTYRFQPIWGP